MASTARLRMARFLAAPMLTLAILALSACAQPQERQAAVPVASSSHQAATAPRPPKMFTLDTPVERIAADRRGKAILLRDVPGLMASKYYLVFDDMSLSQLATLSSGQLTQSKLNLVEADLSQLSPAPPAQ